MRFADHVWLWGTALSLLVAVLLVFGGLAHHRALQRFGDLPLVSALKTARTGPRRALRGILFVTALALAFVAAAQPQYGRGTRIVPATNLDVVLVLDFSKSMYARDISPSRIDRAKAEMATLVKKLAPARFGAVAFAGSAMTFPLTSDGAAVAQFFRGLEPNDMPVGGTAIGRALETAHQLLTRDPQSSKHERLIVLVTDGEDLEGDPVQVAESIEKDHIKIHVVQIGGRAPEPIPDVDENGAVRGMRTGEDGQLLMTSLSAEGEAQLGQIATKSGGTVVRSEKGSTGIETITRELRRVMTEELSERVETTYADVFAYPLALAVVLLVLEASIGTSPKRVRPSEPPLEPKRRRTRRRGAALDPNASAALLVLLLPLLGGCKEVDSALDKVLVHHSPVVDDAIQAIGAKQADHALSLLSGYLETGACEHGVIGTPDRVRTYPDASFDLGLTLFSLGETFGQKFGAEAPDEAKQQDPAEVQKSAQRKEQVECALRLVLPIASNEALSPELRARAGYLAGNLEFLRGEYEAAVKAYDAALLFDPARPKPEAKKDDATEAADAPGALGRDIAHNRAIAVRRIEEKKKEQEKKDQQKQDDDQKKDDQQKQDDDQKKDDQQKQDDQKKDDQQKQDDQKKDQGDQKDQKDQSQGQDQKQDEKKPEGSPNDSSKDQGKDGQQPQAKNQPGEQGPAPESQGPSASQDERLLDDLERAPTFQQQDAEKSAARRGRRRAVMEDK